MLDPSHSFSIAHLSAFEGACAVGVTQALDIRPAALSGFLNPLLSGGQGILGALTDQACLQLCYSGHLREQEAAHRSWWHRRQVAEHEINSARNKGPQEVHVAGKP